MNKEQKLTPAEVRLLNHLRPKEVRIYEYSDSRAADSWVDPVISDRVLSFRQAFDTQLQQKLVRRLGKIDELGEIDHFTLHLTRTYEEMRGSCFKREVDVVDMVGRKFPLERYRNIYGKVTEDS